MTDFAEISGADLLLTTPEKWDSVTRSWREIQAFVCSVSLLLIDEVHLLGDKPRGATLEAVVARMKVMTRKQKQNKKKNPRFSFHSPHNFFFISFHFIATDDPDGACL